MPSLAFSVVDAFTSQPFAGNPAAVVVLEDSSLDDATLQLIARCVCAR
jgi:predicted PhzF superfamily epimerase YddE/YHI9